MKFEIATPPQNNTEKTMTEKSEITDKPETIEAQVAAWSATDAALVAAVEATKGISVAGHAEGPKKGRDAVHKSLMDLAGHRTAIEARRLELKRPILDLGKLVDAEAKRLTAITEPRENELRADRDAYDAEQKRIKDEAEKLERERIAAEAERVRAEALKRLADRVSRIASAGGVPDAIWLATAEDAEVDALVARLESEKAEREAADELERIEREKAEAEERDRLAERAKRDEEERITRAAKEEQERKEQVEADRLAKIEQDRIAAENKKEADRLAAERAEFERIQETARIDAKKAEDERIEKERKEQAERDEAARIEREQIEAKALADKIAAEAPDREKIAAWCSALVIPAHPAIQSDDLRDALEECAMAILSARDALLREVTA